MDFLLGGVVGLVVGWNLLPQPAWVLAIWTKIKNKFTAK